MERDSTILDLHGNIFKKEEWRITLAIPLHKIDKLIYTRDLISGQPFDLAVRRYHKSLAFRAFFYSEVYGTYIEYKLKLIGYDRKSDIRTKYKAVP